MAGELRLVDEQVERMRLIVTSCCSSRPNEFAGYVDEVELAPVLEAAWCWWRTCWRARTSCCVRELHATRRPAINRNELQQVIVNLLVNAVHAMPEGGTLTLATRDAGAEGVEIEPMDTGAGLASEVLAELFQPFVTHKKDGTGLGLWISPQHRRALRRRHPRRQPCRRRRGIQRAAARRRQGALSDLPRANYCSSRSKPCVSTCRKARVKAASAA